MKLLRYYCYFVLGFLASTVHTAPVTVNVTADGTHSDLEARMMPAPPRHYMNNPQPAHSHTTTMIRVAFFVSYAGAPLNPPALRIQPYKVQRGLDRLMARIQQLYGVEAYELRILDEFREPDANDIAMDSAHYSSAFFLVVVQGFHWCTLENPCAFKVWYNERMVPEMIHYELV
ncbi:hypothetical protein EV368DRAFT_87015 [Lentinula lateritia]|uniref:Uncharacterized protein n=1 Tax=Lentinula aff. lateritia TaxID=2804960 RepID=A0ACC1TYR2_9AGAR|nr:hypothetical protein F5876DRAFT_77367 [Lentinula aff. lateritia]KAJ3848073.1 hypothetical protein EV368DRAFT_87015 [Lentinula lateritia]